MINFNEIVAVKNAGVSLQRFMMPFLILGALVTAISIYFNNWVVPEANKQKFFIERNYLGKNVITEGLTRLYFQDSQNQLVLIDQFNEVQMNAKNVSILVYNPKNAIDMTKRIDASEMVWDGGRWKLVNAVERDFENGQEKIANYSEIFTDDVAGIRKIFLKPSDITRTSTRCSRRGWRIFFSWLSGE